MTQSMPRRGRRLGLAGAAAALASLTLASGRDGRCALEPRHFRDRRPECGARPAGYVWGAQWWKDNSLSRSQITKSGNVISCNTTEIALVQVDPGLRRRPRPPRDWDRHLSRLVRRGFLLRRRRRRRRRPELIQLRVAPERPGLRAPTLLRLRHRTSVRSCAFRPSVRVV